MIEYFLYAKLWKKKNTKLPLLTSESRVFHEQTDLSLRPGYLSVFHSGPAEFSTQSWSPQLLHHLNNNNTVSHESLFRDS